MAGIEDVMHGNIPAIEKLTKDKCMFPTKVYQQCFGCKIETVCLYKAKAAEKRKKK